jgi:hypothetical protein
MSSEFDASLVCSEPVSDAVVEEQARTAERLMRMPNAFANARLHAETEMRRLISVCNRIAWRSVPADLRAPAPEETAALLERLSAEDREKLMSESRLAAKQRILVAQLQEAHEQYLAQLQAEPEERNEFDASLICGEPVDAATVEEQVRTVSLLMPMAGAFANAKLHAEANLQRLVQACNRLAWQSVPAGLRAPSPEETAALLERLSPDDRERLMRDARLAAAQRSLLAVMEEVYQRQLAQFHAEQVELAGREALAREWGEFEAYDAAGKQERFAAWRASRRSGV